jgi:hypothetical protein
MLAVFAALIGVLAVRRTSYGLAGLAVFAGLGVTAGTDLRIPGLTPFFTSNATVYIISTVLMPPSS